MLHYLKLYEHRVTVQYRLRQQEKKSPWDFAIGDRDRDHLIEVEITVHQEE